MKWKHMYFDHTRSGKCGVTLQDAIQQFIDFKKGKNTLTVNTIKLQERLLEDMGEYLGKATHVDTITESHVIAMLAYITEGAYKRKYQDSPSAVSTCVLRARLFRGFFQYLYMSGIQSLDPYAVPIPHSKPKIDRDALTDNDVALLRGTYGSSTGIKGVRDDAMIELLVSSGLRSEELRILKRDDFVEIDHVKSIRICGKGDKARICYLTPRAVEMINAYLRIRKDDHPLLFTTHHRGNGMPYRYMRLGRGVLFELLKERRALSGMHAKCNPHRLRKYFATRLIRKGMSIHILKQLLGHASILTTMVYVGVQESFDEQVYQRFFEEV